MCKVKIMRNEAKSITIRTKNGIEHGPYHYSRDDVSSRMLYSRQSLEQSAAFDHNISMGQVSSISVWADLQKDTVYLSDHSLERMKERAGWNKSASIRMVKKAIDYGKPVSEVNGRLGAWLRNQNQKQENENHWYRLYGDYVFIFSKNVLVTVIHKPSNGSYYMRCALKEPM